MALCLEIVSAHGVEFSQTEIDRLVVRRREVDHDPGSEVAICPHHAPMLMQIEPCRMRITRDGVTFAREIPAGVLDVCDDHVIIAIT
ncbi:MAG: hypothetical protein HGB10_10030 [Coriobacteriia bacterium]|nr:hypothetical protein [Coriobacteriia bacterium]